MKTPKLAPFFLFNLVAIGITFLIFFPPVRWPGEAIPFLGSIFVALPIIWMQHRAIVKWTRWWQWLIVFYAGMLVYLFVFGASIQFAIRFYGGEEEFSLWGTLGAGYLMMFVGQVVGLAVLPVIFGANILFSYLCPKSLLATKRA